ncbi:MAG: Holliday junction resolvase RuvX [Ruminococcaceae bacterium]|nr:Holliday junction resolvase RuvX [Oscillospiraceae bacterium]
MRVMGIDYGDARVGIAVSDPLMMTAQGVETVPNRVYSKMLERVAALVKQYEVGTIVLGLPKNMNGTEGERAEVTYAFQKDLLGACPGVEIVLRDERLTTVQAAGVLNVTNTRGKDRKNVIDTVAACIILQSYLDQIRK